MPRGGVFTILRNGEKLVGVSLLPPPLRKIGGLRALERRAMDAPLPCAAAFPKLDPAECGAALHLGESLASPWFGLREQVGGQTLVGACAVGVQQRRLYVLYLRLHASLPCPASLGTEAKQLGLSGATSTPAPGVLRMPPRSLIGGYGALREDQLSSMRWRRTRGREVLGSASLGGLQRANCALNLRTGLKPDHTLTRSSPLCSSPSRWVTRSSASCPSAARAAASASTRPTGEPLPSPAAERSMLGVSPPAMHGRLTAPLLLQVGHGVRRLVRQRWRLRLGCWHQRRRC